MIRAPDLRRQRVGRRAGIVGLLVASLASFVGATDLPNVWERHVDTPGFGKPFLELLPMRDGDVAIASGEVATAFFSGRRVDRARAALGVEPPAAQPYSATLVDGRHVRRVGPPGCVRRPGVTVALADASQHVQQAFAWVWIPETPLTLAAAECALSERPPLTQRAVILDPKVIALADGGFLLGDARAGIVLRFDAAFETHSPLFGTRLLRMPAAELDAMVAAHAAAERTGDYDWDGFQRSLETWVGAQGVGLAPR